MAVDNSRKKSTPPRPNLPPEGQPWGRWVTDTLNDLKLETGGVKREVISSNKNHNSQLQMSAQQKREIVKVNLKAEEALNIALAASGSTTIYFVAPETPEQGDIWYENVTGIWFRWVDDQWVPITDETLLEALEAILAQRIANDDKIRTFAQDTEPTGMTTEHVGDLWYDTDDKNKLYRWDGLEWVPIRDAGITEAQDAADAAQGTADDAKTVADDAKETADTAADVVTQLEAQVTADLGDMQGRLVTAEGELTTLTDTTLPALDTRLGSAETAVSDAEGRLVTAEGDLTDLTTNVLPGLTGALDDVQGDLSDHAARMTAAEQAVAAAEGRLTGAEGELATLTGTTLPALDTRLGSAESAVSAAEGRLTTAEGELTTLDSELSQIDTALSGLQTEVDNLVIPSVDGLNKLTYSTGVPSATAGYKEGDTWFRYTGTGASRVIYGQWHFTGSVWNEVALRNEMIASLDAGKVTTGFLDAARIEANTVTADKLLVGSFDNLIADVVNDTSTTEPHVASTFGTLLAQGDSADADGVSPGKHLFAGRTEGDDGITRPVMTWGGPDGTNRIRVEPGGTYRFSVLTRLGGSYPNGTGHMRLAVREMSAGGTYITYLSHGGNHSPTWFWQEHVAEFTVGPGTYFVNLEIRMTAVGANYRLALPQFRQMNAGELIVDGAITGSKILAGSITATDAVFDTGAIQNADIGNLNAAKINAGTLAAARIGAGSIDSTKISSYNLTTTNATIGNAVVKDAAIASLNASKINAGELDAARIGANSITADKVLVASSENALTDPNFENAASWNLPSGVTLDAGGVDGMRRLSIAASTLQRGGYLGADSTPEAVASRIPVRPGDMWRVEAKVRSGSAIPAGSSRVAMFARFYTERGGNHTSNPLIGGADGAIAGGTWGNASGSIKVPEGANFMVVGFFAQSAHNSTVWWSAPVARLMTGATLIENGAVTTDKVAADAITGNKIKAGSITATHGVFATGAIQNADIGNLNATKINAGTLNAARIGADTIEGKHIKGGSITANDAIFANAAIKAADIASINADTITVGTLRGINISGVTIEGETSLSLTQGGDPLMESTSEGLALYPPGTPNTRTVFRTEDTGGNAVYMGIVREQRVGAYWRTRSSVLLGTLPNAGGDGVYTDIETGRIATKRLSVRERLTAYRAEARKGITHDSPRGGKIEIQSRVQMDTLGDGPLEAVQGTFSLGTSQTITSTGQTQIRLNTTSPESSNIHLATGGLIQPAHPGVYAIEANVQFGGGESGYWRNIYFRMNGEQVRTFSTVSSGSSRMVNATAILAHWDQAPTFEVYTSGGGTGMEINTGIEVSVTRIGG